MPYQPSEIEGRWQSFWDAEQTFAAREDLPFGGRFLVKAGHAIGRHDVSLFALDSDDDGVLARQQELFNLGREQHAQTFIANEAKAASERAESTAMMLAEGIDWNGPIAS